MTTLQDLIDRALVKQQTKSINKLAKIARAASFPLTQTTLWKIHNGTYTSNPTQRTLEAIAYLAGVSLATTRAAAGIAPPGEPYEPPPGSDRLTAKERAAVDEVIRVILNARSTDSVQDHAD